MFNTLYNMRPLCAEVLSAYNQWGTNKMEVLNSNGYKAQVIQFQKCQNTFFLNYLKAKLNE